MPPRSTGRRDVGVLMGSLLTILAMVVGVRLLPTVSSTTAALALLLVVLATSTFGRLWISMTVALAATLALNFFFLPPVGTFTIAEPYNWVALFAFLVTAVIASNVVAIAIERTQFLNERKAAELIRQKADLAATLLASLSHDLRTPLTAIGAAVENLRDELPVGDRIAQASAASVELDRLNRLFQDILDMARIDAAAVQVERQWVTPADVVDAASAHVRHALNGQALRLDAEAEVEVEIDPRVASVALSHLLENAAQYSSADCEIVVQARAEADGLHVAVTDHGPGLDASELEHLFERFYRGQTARRLAPGTGMGLAITRGLLSAVGGRVWAENTGGGARFTMVVPAASRPISVRA